MMSRRCIHVDLNLKVSNYAYLGNVFDLKEHGGKELPRYLNTVKIRL